MALDLLTVEVRTVDDKVKFAATGRENREITVDYFPPVGGGEGFTSLELLLAGFATCVGTTLLFYLRSILHKSVASLGAKANGTVRTEHPRALSHIQLEVTIESPDVGESDVKTALTAAETRLCPVWAMIKGNVAVDISYTIRA